MSEDRAAAREDERRRRRLRRSLQERGAGDHEVAGQPVGEHAAADEHERLGDLADREDDPEVGRGADVEHREREGDAGQAVADGGDHGAAEQQPEVALLERAKVLSQPHDSDQPSVAL